MALISLKDVNPGQFIALGKSTFVKLHDSVKPQEVGLVEKSKMENFCLLVDIERSSGAAYITPKSYLVAPVDIDFYLGECCVVRTWGMNWTADLHQDELNKVAPLKTIAPGTIFLLEEDFRAIILFHLNEGTLISLADGKIFCARTGLCFPLSHRVYE